MSVFPHCGCMSLPGSHVLALMSRLISCHRPGRGPQILSHTHSSQHPSHQTFSQIKVCITASMTDSENEDIPTLIFLLILFRKIFFLLK